MPTFVSKIPGTAQHIIGKIRYTSQKSNLHEALEDFVENGFTNIYKNIKKLTPLCWCIQVLELTVGGAVQTIHNLTIYFVPKIGWSYDYREKNLENPELHAQFVAKMQQWLTSSMPSDISLYQATAGHETGNMVQEALDCYVKSL